MPLPPPPGYRRGRQLRVDRRRIALAAFLAALAAGVLLALAQQAARTPGELLRPLPTRWILLVVLGAGFCGGWGETMRQLALTSSEEEGEAER